MSSRPSRTRHRQGLHLGLIVLALAVLTLAMALAVSIGEIHIPLVTTFKALSNALGVSEYPLDRIHESIIREYRLSRALVAACCGAGLALCGAILQALLRNPLAEPYVLGISAGASTGAVCIMVLGVGGGVVGLSLGAFLPAVLQATIGWQTTNLITAALCAMMLLWVMLVLSRRRHGALVSGAA